LKKTKSDISDVPSTEVSDSTPVDDGKKKLEKTKSDISDVPPTETVPPKDDKSKKAEGRIF
jgi:hypothetical protein